MVTNHFGGLNKMLNYILRLLYSIVIHSTIRLYFDKVIKFFLVPTDTKHLLALVITLHMSTSQNTSLH